jgi:hypothetical protein
MTRKARLTRYQIIGIEERKRQLARADRMIAKFRAEKKAIRNANAIARAARREARANEALMTAMEYDNG